MSIDQKQVCAYCKHWCIKHPSTPEDRVMLSIGQCRISAPKVMCVGSDTEGYQPKTVFPLMTGADWCGSFTERRDDHEVWS